MIDFRQLADSLQLCAQGELSIDDFEEWFEEASWNVHQSHDRSLIGAVFGIEALFSAFYDKRIDEGELLREFAARARAMEREWMRDATSPFPCAMLEAKMGVPIETESRSAGTALMHKEAGISRQVSFSTAAAGTHAVLVPARAV